MGQRLGRFPQAWGTGSGAVLVLLVIGVAMLAPPRRFTVLGDSMAPALRSGDVVQTGWFSLCDRLVAPRRFECWVLRVADADDPTSNVPVLKRVVGLPGEDVSLVEGDVVVAGRLVLKSPAGLASVAVHVPSPALEAPRTWQRPATEMLDDVALDMDVPHALLPVRDGGLAAVIDVEGLPAHGFVRLRVEVGPATVSWRIRATGRYGCVAGRLDGHLVGACWPLRPSDIVPGRRSCLPPRPPTTWQVAEPWPQAATTADVLAPRIALRLDGSGAAELTQVSAWRDVLYRPVINGTASWRPAAGEFVVLGDVSVASRDSRHWGPVTRASLFHRVLVEPDAIKARGH